MPLNNGAWRTSQGKFNSNAKIVTLSSGVSRIDRSLTGRPQLFSSASKCASATLGLRMSLFAMVAEGEPFGLTNEQPEWRDYRWVWASSALGSC